MLRDILEAILSFFKTDPTIGVIVLALCVVAGLTYLMYKLVRRNKSINKTAHNLVQHSEQSTALHQLTQRLVSQKGNVTEQSIKDLRDVIETNYSELKVAVGMQREISKELQSRLENIQGEMLRRDAQSFVAMKGIIDNLGVVTTKVMDISGGLKTVMLAIIKDMAKNRR